MSGFAVSNESQHSLRAVIDEWPVYEVTSITDYDRHILAPSSDCPRQEFDIYSDSYLAFEEDDFFIGGSNIKSMLDGDGDDLGIGDVPAHGSSEVKQRSATDRKNSTIDDSHDHEGGDNTYLQLGQRLNDRIPFDDGSIAFGTIRVYEDADESSGTITTYMRGRNYDDWYPNMIIKNARSRRTLRLDGLSIGTKLGITTLRVYILPQDVYRSNRPSMKDFHKLVKYLLNFVDCSVKAWTGEADPSGPVCTYPEPFYDVEESLFYIFNTLRSPSPNLNSLKDDMYGAQAVRDALEDSIVGVKTKLYPHQKRSVAAMIQKEADPTKVRDPRKVKMLDIYGNTFYLDHNDGSLCRHQPLYSEPRGGILAETMGYGKTLICLGVILATRGHYPSIPHYCIENQELELHSPTPSLLSMAARRLKHEALPWKNEFYMLKKAGLHYDRCVEELKKHERSYNEPVAGTMNPTRRGKPEYVNTVRLCSATLVVVPPNLVIQWQQEIKKHIDEDAIDVFVVDAPNIKIPPWQQLIKYDIVLMSKSRFEQEYRDDDLNQGKGIRYGEKYKSPLTDVRWLRVICDEGHAFAGSSSKTNAMAMLDKMFIERRWVVSGTPSSNLHGIDVSLASTEIETPRDSQSPYMSALKQRRAPHAQDLEAKDLERLRVIVVNFLKLQPWSNKKGDDTADWKTYLAPRVNHKGNRHSMPALREVMQTLIVRHRIQDVDCDLTLPDLHTKVVYVEPCLYDKLSLNLFLMVLASNFVTSEREDEDYMFHPKNRGKLTTLINNMGHGTFYWVGFTHQNVRDTLDVSTRYLDKHIDQVSDGDGLLLTEAILVGETAMSDSGWLSFSTLHEMGVYISNFPEPAKTCWALDGAEAEPLLLGTTQAREVQQHVLGRTPASPNLGTSLKTYGHKIMGAARTRAAEAQKLREKQQVNTKHNDVGATEEPSRRGPTTSMPTPKARKRASVRKIGNSDLLDGDANDSGLADSFITGFASAKLTYLCNRLASHPEEKSIIFYNHNNTAFFIAEALELLGIPFLIYANTLSVRMRAEYLAKFNVDMETKVLLMDVKQAGQGLHVAAASRVYLVSPIWDQAMESQAIKRAHRIGQTREVFVETLVLKGTFEEALVKRRMERVKQEQSGTLLKGDASEEADNMGPESTSKKAKNAMLDDSVMVKVLKDITFLKMADTDEKFVKLDKPVPLARAGRLTKNDDHPSCLPTSFEDVPDVTNNETRTANIEPLHRSIFGGQPLSSPELTSRPKRRGRADSWMEDSQVSSFASEMTAPKRMRIEFAVDGEGSGP